MALPAQAPALDPLVVDLHPVDDPFHLLDRNTSFKEDLALLLKENHYEASDASTAPKLILAPSVTAIQGGYAYGVIVYLQRPGEPGGLRSASATATRSKQDLGPGLRQAIMDATASLLVRLKRSPESPVKSISFQDSPRPGTGYAFVPIQDLRARVLPDPPRLSSIARSHGIEGLVKVSILIGPDGLPQRTDLLSGPPELAFTSLAYTFQCAYEPDKDGRTLRTELTIPYGKRSAADLGLPGMAIERNRPRPAETQPHMSMVQPEF